MFALVLAETGMAASVLIVPPNGFYHHGMETACSQKGTGQSDICNQWKKGGKKVASIFSEVCTTVFENIQSGITGFNRSSGAIRKGIGYTASYYAIPAFLNNQRIKKFYDYISRLDKKKAESKLQLLVSKNNIDCVIWAEFKKNTKKNIRDCLNHPADGDIPVILTLNFYSNGIMSTREIRLKFKQNFYDISYKSRMAIRNHVSNYLKKQHHIAVNQN